MAAALVIGLLTIPAATAEGSGVGTPTRESLPLTRPAPEKCPDARRGLAYYKAQALGWREKMGAGVSRAGASRKGYVPIASCPLVRRNAALWRKQARAARKRYEAWRHYHYAWADWLPDKWQRIGACETGYGRRPGQWTWNSGTYQGAFGFYHGSWDAFVPYASPKARPYPSEAYLATPRQQYEVALAIWRRYGFSGWGCRGA